MTVGHEDLLTYRTVVPHNVGPTFLSPQARAILGFLAFLITYYFAFTFSRSVGAVSPFWFPDSILLCALLKSRPTFWSLFIFGTLFIRLLFDSLGLPLWVKVTAFGIDSVQVLATALVLRRFMANPLRFQTLADIAVFIVFAVVLIPALSAFAGAATRQIAGGDFWTLWLRWFMGDALAQSVVTPIIFYWVFGTPWKVQALDAKRLSEAALLSGGLLVASYWCAMSSVAISDPSFYAPVPFLFWAAVRFGMIGATGAIAVITAFIIDCVLRGSGPFANLPPLETAFVLQTYLLVRSVPLYLFATSIEQRRRVEESLRESEQRFRAIADSAPIMLWVCDTDKGCTFVNQGWLAFTGRAREQELGYGWADRIHADDLEHSLEAYRSAFDARKPFQMEYRARRNDGEYRWVLDCGAPRTGPGGEFVGYIGSVLDITDRKTADENNRTLAHVQRLAIMGELTAAVAHELRQPSAAIMSNAEAALVLLDTGDAPVEELREIVTDIKHANLRANEVLGHIQNFLRKRETRKLPLDVNTVVSDVLLLIAGDSQKRRIHIQTDLGEGLPVVEGHRTHLQQVLLNLIINAMDAMSNTPPEKRKLVIRTFKPSGDARVEVAVSDSGSGIAPTNLPRVFESFFTTRDEGMGLGLSVARSIVEAHGGQIWADNNPGGGATFHFTVKTASRQRTAV